MTAQASLFEPEPMKPWQTPGAVARDVAIHEVEVNADEQWKDEAWKALKDIARHHATFTADDLWDFLEHSEASTHEPRALGALMQRARREGVAMPTDRTTQSSITRRHARPVRVWRSLIH